MNLRIAIIYYSKTGRTRSVANYIKRRLVGDGFKVDVFEVKPAREYMSFLLHLNPRIIYETISGKVIRIVGLEDFNPKHYDLIFLGSPIWFETIAPPVRSFIEIYGDEVNVPVICFSTSSLKRNYSMKFRRILEERSFNVISAFNITDLNRERHLIDEVLVKIRRMIGQVTA